MACYTRVHSLVALSKCPTIIIRQSKRYLAPITQPIVESVQLFITQQHPVPQTSETISYMASYTRVHALVARSKCPTIIICQSKRYPLCARHHRTVHLRDHLITDRTSTRLNSRS